MPNAVCLVDLVSLKACPDARTGTFLARSIGPPFRRKDVLSLERVVRVRHRIDLNMSGACGSGIVPHLYRDFEVRRFADPAVVWLNRRFLAGRGVDITDEQLVGAWRSRIAEVYGVTAPSPGDPPAYCANEMTVMHADRYGGPFGSQHGGSGRSGTIGDFSAKGVGRTPLCDPEADFYHAHGCMWLEEAIREAAFSELAWFEFPLRANPVVAIIDTGARYVSPDGRPGERRAIVVRLAAWRIAHLERSIFFGSAGTADSDQYLDALRVREAIAALPSLVAAGLTGSGGRPYLEALAALIANVARQMGSGRAARLAHGDYTSSNIGLSGELLDFGSFRAVHDWRQAHSVRGIAPFGQEHINFIPTIENVYTNILKYTSEEPRVSFATMIGALVDGMASAFNEEIEALARPFGEVSPRLADCVREQLTEAYHKQQRAGVSYLAGDRGHDTDWIYDGLAGSQVASNPASETGAVIRKAVAELAAKLPSAHAKLSSAFNQLCYWARPKTAAGREILQEKVNRILAEEPSRAELEVLIATFVNEVLTSVCRKVPCHDRDEYVVAQRIDPSYSVVATHRPETDIFSVVVQGLHPGWEIFVDASSYGGKKSQVDDDGRANFPVAVKWEFSSGDDIEAFLNELSSKSGISLEAQREHSI
jgi:hypothetical protein